MALQKELKTISVAKSKDKYSVELELKLYADGVTPTPGTWNQEIGDYEGGNYLVWVRQSYSIAERYGTKSECITRLGQKFKTYFQEYIDDYNTEQDWITDLDAELPTLEGQLTG